MGWKTGNSKTNVGRQALPISTSIGLLALGILGLTRVYGQTATDLLVQADGLADQGVWSKARPIYADAEAEFQRLGDHRNQLQAKLGRLRGDVQAGSYTSTREKVVRVLDDPNVQNDPQLKIRALALLGNIDLNLNTAAAQEDWKAVLDVATAAGDKKWQNRANGGLGLVAGVNGNTGVAAAALFQAITRAYESGDVPSAVHFATWLANGMSVNGMADRALQLIDRAGEVARKNGYAQMPLELTIAKIRALLLLPDSKRERGRQDAKALLMATLEYAQKDGVLGAQTELLIQAAQLAVEDRDYAAAEQHLTKAGQIAKEAHLPREEAEVLLKLSRLYNAINQPVKAAAIIDQGIAVLQHVEEGYDLPLFLAEKAKVQAALGALGTADLLYGQATDLVEGLLVNAQSSRAEAPAEFRSHVLRSNWAPLWVALEHHLPAECWVIATQGDTGSAAQFEKAKTLLAEVSPKTRFHLETVANPYDLGLVVAAVHRIYDAAAHRYNLEPKEVIADFTGATAAMSGGVILATLSADRHLEYLRQDVALLDGGVALSADRIRAACPLVWIESSPGLADTPAKRAGRAE